MTALLSVQDLHVGYGHVRVLEGVSLEIPERGLVALVGSNGAGLSSGGASGVAGLRHLSRRAQAQLAGGSSERLAPGRPWQQWRGDQRNVGSEHLHCGPLSTDRRHDYARWALGAGRCSRCVETNQPAL